MNNKVFYTGLLIAAPMTILASVTLGLLTSDKLPGFTYFFLGIGCLVTSMRIARAIV